MLTHTGVYLGHSKEKYRVCVPMVTKTQLDLIETTSVDYEGMAKKLFELIFAEALDQKTGQSLLY